MPTLVSNVILLPAAVAALLIADWRLGLVAFVVLPPALILSRWFQRVSHAANVEQRNTIAAVTAQIAESVAGMAVVQAYNRERASRPSSTGSTPRTGLSRRTSSGSSRSSSRGSSSSA